MQKFCSFLLLFWFGITGLHAQGSGTIHPGEVWLNTDGKAIQAHGGGVLREGSYWYWFGEDQTEGHDASRRFVSCY